MHPFELLELADVHENGAIVKVGEQLGAVGVSAAMSSVRPPGSTAHEPDSSGAARNRAYACGSSPIGGAPRWSTARDRIEVLSPREREVAALIGNGLSNAQIAQRLHLVEGTVKGYVSAVLDGLDVDNRVQAALIAYDVGLVDDA